MLKLSASFLLKFERYELLKNRAQMGQNGKTNKSWNRIELLSIFTKLSESLQLNVS